MNNSSGKESKCPANCGWSYDQIEVIMRHFELAHPKEFEASMKIIRRNKRERQ